ncbi:H-NS family nucleoid-associated regulatory protein [Sabulicella rubraurantiaca]|uniref:H-NS family nucleoid-associated regulatory protein n=1 Tax=Sabulicella rubraurantiaca TaxID=2811429 RepID=UPI001A97B364
MDREQGRYELTLFEFSVSPTQPTGRSRGKSARKGERESPAPEYRGPNRELWSGHGRMPRWLQADQACGKSRDEFLIG